MLNKAWFYAAGIRAFKTFVQVLASVYVVGMRIEAIDWAATLSIAAGAAVFSILTSLKGLPELGCAADGIMQIDTSDPKKDTYKLILNGDVADLADKKSVTFTVKK
jgi:hypothetical protein